MITPPTATWNADIIVEIKCDFHQKQVMRDAVVVISHRTMAYIRTFNYNVRNRLLL